MGEAKRRKELDPTYGKSVGQFLAEQWQLPELQPEDVTGWVVALTIVLERKPSVFVYEAPEQDCRQFWQEVTNCSIDNPEYENPSDRPFEETGVASLVPKNNPVCMLSIMRPDGFARFVEKSVPLWFYSLPAGNNSKLLLLSILTTLKASESEVQVDTKLVPVTFLEASA